MKKHLLITLLSLFLLIGCSSESKPTQNETKTKEPAQQEPVKKGSEVIADNLKIPWSIQKDGDTFYISERVGNIAKVDSNGKVTRQKVNLKSNLSTIDEGGFLGFILDDNFSDNKNAFAYYTYTSGSRSLNKIVKLHLDGNQWNETTTLLSNIPGSNNHNGGRLKVGPDNKLYATVGDAYNDAAAQNRNSLSGTILRLNLNGSIPKDNPYQDSYVYSYGHRNPQGLVWNSDGKMYASEHGNNANDEINVIEAKHNYGWPVIEGKTTRSGMETPLLTSGSNKTWAPSGIDLLDNKLYVASLRGTAVLEIDLKTKKIRTLIDDLGRIRDVYIDGTYLYFVSNNTDGRGNPQKDDDKLYRINLVAY